MIHSASLSIVAIPGLILLAGVIDDLRSKKIHNKLVLAAFLLAVVSQSVIHGLGALPQAGLAVGAAFFVSLPLVLARALGAGDMKLLMALAPLFLWTDILWMFFYALIWGALLGIIRSMLQGQAGQLVRNTLALTGPNRPDRQSLQSIPFSVALLFGWMTHLSWLQMGGYL